MLSNTIRSRTVSLTWLVGISTLLAMSDGAAAGDLTLAGDVTNPGSYTISELQSLPSTTVGAYTGVSLWTFLGDGSDVIVGFWEERYPEKLCHCDRQQRLAVARLAR